MDHLPANHPVLPPAKTGVLLLNLGTPDGTDYFSLRRYLAEFLSDTRVIDAPRWFWLPLLHGIILTTRPRRSGHAYKKIWNHDQNESPLKTHTRTQAQLLSLSLTSSSSPSSSSNSSSPPPLVTWAMRYGNPSTASAVNDLIAQGCTRILALALYPQYSATTTASAYDKLFDALKRVKRQPALTTLGSYHDHPLYIDALAQSVRRALAWKEGTPAPSPHKPSEPQPQKLLPPQGGGWEGGIHGTSSAKTTARLLSHRERAEGEGSPPPTPAPLPPLLLDPNDPTLPETIVVSFHGLPQRYFEEGDPYHCHCMKTSRLLRESLGWPAERWATSFQSRFGPAKWLEPYTSDTILRLAREGKKHIAILSPGFASDCIETLEELNIGLREQFLHEGGERFTYIPCLNTDEAHIRLLKALVEEAL